MNIPRLKSFVKRRIQYIFTLSDLLFLRCGFILTANELKKTAAEPFMRQSTAGRETSVSIAYQCILNKIVNGELPPGTPLR